MKDVTAAETHRGVDHFGRGVLRGRPSPLPGTYMLLRVEERDAGRELLRRVLPANGSAADPDSPTRDAWVSAAVTP